MHPSLPCSNNSTSDTASSSNTKTTTSSSSNNNDNIPLLTCALLAALTTGGPVYAFGLYGGDLKTQLELSQSQLDTISSSNFCAGLLSWIPGLLVDHFGVKIGLVSGGCLGCTFMMAYWVVAKQLLVLPNQQTTIAALCGFGILIFMSNALVIGSVYKILVSTCTPHTKGSAVGAAKGYVGLGSGVYACLFRALKTNTISDLDFLPMAALLAVLVGSLPAVVLLPSDEEINKLLQIPKVQLDRTCRHHFRMLYFGLVLLATIVIGTTMASLLQDEDYSDNDVPEKTQYVSALFIVLAWLAPILSLLVLPHKSASASDTGGSLIAATAAAATAAAAPNGTAYESIQDAVQEALSEEINKEEEESHETDEFIMSLPRKTPSVAAVLAYGAEITDSVQVRGPRGMLGRDAVPSHDQVPNLTLFQMLKTTPAWLFAWVATVRVGGGTMVTNNLGQMVESLGLSNQSNTMIPAALALFSVAQAFSRVMTGAVSDWALSWNLHSHFTRNRTAPQPHAFDLDGIPRPAFLIVASFAGVLAHLFMSITTTRTFFLVGVCFSGAAFGMIWPLMVLITGEVFGTANMGANYMFYDGLASALGTLFLSKFVTQEVYEQNIETEDDRTCYGRNCFWGTHIITAILSFTCVLASYWFYQATRHVYAKCLY